MAFFLVSGKSNRKKLMLNGWISSRCDWLSLLFIQHSCMLHSMTAYGRATAHSGQIKSEVELRSVNSKFLDLRIKMPLLFKDKEMEIRQLVTTHVERGKVELNITITGSENTIEAPSIDPVLFRKYVREIQALTKELDLPPGDIIAQVLRIPQVLSPSETGSSKLEWQLTHQALLESFQAFIHFRKTEGAAMASDLVLRIESIQALIEELTPLENERIKKTRARIRQNLSEFLENEQLDHNRYEQEILFYLEKMDINEEKVRLGQHCIYFLQEIETDDHEKGRKLNFISQEIGREINTLGAKAYDSGIQQIVILMKNELEKIKEQLANIL